MSHEVKKSALTTRPGTGSAAANDAGPLEEFLAAPLDRFRSGGKWLTLLLLQLAVIFVFGIPFLWLLLGGLRPERDLLGNLYPFGWNTIIPSIWTLDNVRYVMQLGYGRNLLNSFFVAAATVPIALLFDSMAAFALAWLRVPIRRILVGILLLILIIPEQSTIVPLYLVVTELGLINSYTALILPFVARPFGILVLQQFLRELPKELVDAATVDGASPFQIYWRVMLPNVVPALITVGLVDFMFAWNQFFWPLIAIQSREKQMAQVAVGTFITPDQTLWSQLFAASALAALPVIVLFLALQRYYIRGVARTGLHG